MRKRVWGKNAVALALSAALFATNVAPLSAQAESISDDILGEEVELEDLEKEAVSDGNAEGTESDTVNPEENSNENSDASENGEKPSDEVTPSEEQPSDEEKPSEEQNSDEEQSSDETKENPEDKENPEEKDAEESDSERKENPDEAFDAEVSDGDAEATPEVSDGNAGDVDAETGAFDYEEKIDGYKIKLHAEPGVVPVGTVAVISEAKKVAGQKVDELVNDALPAESAVLDSASFDIALMKDGVEFEPEGIVSVEITLDDELADVAKDNEAASVQVFHIEDDATTTEVPAEVDENATDIYGNGEDTVVSYDADSFSVYDVSVVVDFETSVAEAHVNPVYEGKIKLDDEDIKYLTEDLDSTVNVKSLLASGGNCTSLLEMAEVARTAIKNRQTMCTINFKIPRYYAKSSIANDMFPMMYQHTGVPNEGDAVRWAYINMSWQTTAANVGDLTYGTLQLKFVYTHDLAQEIATQNAINQIIAANNLNTGTDYEKIKKTYNYITNNILYDHDCAKNWSYYKNPIGYSCYSAAVLKLTVCEGYALLFYRIMLTLGIDARLVAGNAYASDSNSGHGWNIVKLGDKYYYCDATWDAKETRTKQGTTKLSKHPAFKAHFLKKTGYSTNVKCPESGYTFNRVDFDVTEHMRYAEYKTADFYKVYPVSTSDYNPKTATSYIKPTGVVISQTSAIVKKGTGLDLVASCVPAYATQGIVWNSSDDTVASVINGHVTGLKNGECEIFATSIYGGQKAKCRVLVTDDAIKEVTVPALVTVYAGSTAAINPVVFPEWVPLSGLRYTSYNTKVATVDSHGIVKGWKAGTTTISITYIGGGIFKSLTVRVLPSTRVKSIKISKKTIKLKKGKKYRLKVKFKPSNASNKGLTYKSSKPSVCSVDSSGRLHAKKKGKAKITVRSKDGKHKATCIVKVR